MKKPIAVLFIIVFTAAFVSAQDKKDDYPLIKKLSWIAGSYQGEKWGGMIEEYWSAPQGNNMIGMYRMVKDGAIVFTELMYITEENNTLTLKLKHFSKDFKGWEEKDETENFPFLGFKENEAIFEGLSFKKPGEGLLTITVMIQDKKTGEAKPEDFEYKRIK